jgi:hypothetical protein
VETRDASPPWDHGLRCRASDIILRFVSKMGRVQTKEEGSFKSFLTPSSISKTVFFFLEFNLSS